MNKDLKILYAEDDVSLREVLSDLLEVEGYNCKLSVNGSEARELIKQESFDLLITDFRLPRMDGADLLLWCRENDMHFPVIFLTAYYELLKKEKVVLRDCCVSILPKPVNVDELILEIEKALQRKHEFDCRGRTALPGEYDFTGQHLMPG